MVKFAADENFNGKLLLGIKNRLPDIDVVRVQDGDMYESSDPELLDWLADENRVLLTHDVQTIPGFFYKRVNEGKKMPGVILVRESTTMGDTLDDLEVVMGAGQPQDFEDIIVHVPLG